LRKDRFLKKLVNSNFLLCSVLQKAFLRESASRDLKIGASKFPPNNQPLTPT